MTLLVVVQFLAWWIWLAVLISLLFGEMARKGCVMGKEERYKKFRDDMGVAGYRHEEYSGRNYYKGPAVRVWSNELQDVIRATTIHLEWDQIGRDAIIVYPG